MSGATQDGRRKPGRPNVAEETDLRDVILDQAELAFAESGFSGTRTRDVAERAKVNHGLIRYYFGSKDALFEAVFRRRGGVVSSRRLTLLESLLAENTAPSVEDILHAYLKPQWDMKHSGPAGAAFIRLQAHIHAETAERALKLRSEVYDASLKRYIQTLSSVLPEIPTQVVALRMAFFIGSYLFMLNDLGRLGDLTDGETTHLEPDAMLHHLVRFFAAGMRAPVA
ncbi:TetR/AcrR family transcriptional regulator [Rhodospirillaceae bacterium KN72]|uniref:TetR/AcrR family transcriptional regulator n=1 Tax=Pacificispira spongiicola TaxID=2729598 RepID=A0A7Y0HD46_9PROT|nr:TetR/AcrR family transcriptional regulator [Pacificispira spongiicola]NMM43416.1 TetR/AcrR family transcriptional regulator [Pacificispira spongiicola]